MLLLLLLLLSCATTREQAPVQEPVPQEEQAPPATPEVDSDCVRACEQARAMEAVAWEVIQADCQASCGAQPEVPLQTRDLEEPPSGGQD